MVKIVPATPEADNQVRKVDCFAAIVDIVLSSKLLKVWVCGAGLDCTGPVRSSRHCSRWHRGSRRSRVRLTEAFGQRDAWTKAST